MITVNTTKTAKESVSTDDITIDSSNISQLSKKLSLEAQEELRHADSYYRQLGSQAESIILKTLLDFEKTITNGRYFNGNSIVSDKVLIARAFRELSQEAARELQDEYPNLTMTKKQVEAWYDIQNYDPDSFADDLYIEFYVDCTDSNGNSFEGKLIGRSNIYYPDRGSLCRYRNLEILD